MKIRYLFLYSKTKFYHLLCWQNNHKEKIFMFSTILRTITDFSGHALGRLHNEDEHSNAQTQSRLSGTIGSFIAVIFAFCGSIISLLNMSNLSMDSVGTTIYHLKDPTIGSTLTAISDDSLAHKFLVIPYLITLTSLAILAMTPFNAFFASQDGRNFVSYANKIYQKLRYGQPLSNIEENWLLSSCNVLDLFFKMLATIGAGSTLGMIAVRALNEINEIINHDDIPDSLALATIIFITIFAGKPIANVVIGILSEETGRFANTIKTLFTNLIKLCKKAQSGESELLIARDKQSSEKMNRAKLTSIAYKALDTAQLTHGKQLAHIDPGKNVSEILAELQSQEVSVVKSLIVEGLTAATFFISYSGSKYVVKLAGSSIQTLMPILNFFNIDNDNFATQAAAETIGIAGQISFILIWTLLLKNAVHRPLMRMFTSEKPLIKLNFNSIGEGFNYSLAYLFGFAVGMAQIPLINFTANDYILQLMCAIFSNISFSSAGFNQGRKDDAFLKTIHWPRFFSLNKDIHDHLSEKLLQLLKNIPFMSDDKVTELLNNICRDRRDVGPSFDI